MNIKFYMKGVFQWFSTNHNLSQSINIWLNKDFNWATMAQNGAAFGITFLDKEKYGTEFDAKKTNLQENI